MFYATNVYPAIKLAVDEANELSKGLNVISWRVVTHHSVATEEFQIVFYALLQTFRVELMPCVEASEPNWSSVPGTSLGFITD